MVKAAKNMFYFLSLSFLPCTTCRPLRFGPAFAKCCMKFGDGEGGSCLACCLESEIYLHIGAHTDVPPHVGSLSGHPGKR